MSVTLQMGKSIKVSDQTHKELTKLGNKGETYEEIIIRLIRSAKH